MPLDRLVLCSAALALSLLSLSACNKKDDTAAEPKPAAETAPAVTEPAAVEPAAVDAPSTEPVASDAPIEHTVCPDPAVEPKPGEPAQPCFKVVGVPVVGPGHTR